MGHERFIYTLRRETKKNRIRLRKEGERTDATERKKVERYDKIREYSETKPEKAVRLIVKGILENAREEARLGEHELVWKPEENVRFRDWVVTELRKMKLKVKIRCGHGHGGYAGMVYKDDLIGCKGTTYSTCWPEVVISW